MADEHGADPSAGTMAKLTPAARGALRRSLLYALERPPSPAILAAQLVNTTVETLDLTRGMTMLAQFVARASRDAERAPLVRVDHGGDYALLTSAPHVWRLVDRIDELEIAIAVLAGACVRGFGQTERMERLLEELDA